MVSTKKTIGVLNLVNMILNFENNKINLNNTLITIGTCNKYKQTRLKYQFDTFIPDIPLTNMQLFFQYNQIDHLYNYKVTSLKKDKNQELITYRADPSMFFSALTVLAERNFQYFVMITDDCSLDIRYLFEKLNKLKNVQYLYAGIPRIPCVNGYKFKKGLAAGGSVRVFNKQAVLYLLDYYPEKYYKLIKKRFKDDDYQFTMADDVITGYIFQQQGIELQSIYNEPIVNTMMQTFPNVSDCKKYIQNVRQVGYHFLYGLCPLPLKYQNKYLESMMHFAYDKWCKNDNR